MKKIIFMLLLLSCLMQTKAQEYHPFPLLEGEWIVGDQHYGEYPAYHYYAYKRDTVIDNKSYKIIGNGDINIKGNDVALREDTVNQKVYVIYLHNLSSYTGWTDICVDEDGNNFDEDSTEYLLYDFNLQVGDTIDVFFSVRIFLYI